MLGFAAGGIALAVDAEDGGRITSLVAHGRHWLAPAVPRSAEGAFTATPPGGWDEIAPTVAASTTPEGRPLLDHGDAWRRPWTVEAASETVLAMAVELPSLGVNLRRTIRASRTGVLLSYRATTGSTVPLPLLWCAHPLFDATTGARIVGAGELREEYPHNGAPLRWPSSVGSGALKAYGSGITTAAIVHPDGRAVRMRWDLPHVGLYWDGGEFSDRPVLAIEPSTGASDSAATAWARLPLVSASAPLTWSVELAAE